MIFIYKGSLAMKLMTFMINIVQSIKNQVIPWQSWTFPDCGSLCGDGNWHMGVLALLGAWL